MIGIEIQKKLNASQGTMVLDVNCKLPTGSFTAVYGKSGVGKTSLLRILAGLLQPDQGKITVDGNVWLDKKSRVALTPQKRGVGFVFQDYALFPHMTVKENLQFALAKSQEKKVVDELLDMCELGALADLKPAILSGGQKQRVAVARALVQRPGVLLLDEALSALDHEMRTKLQDYILALHKEFQLTTLLVSHDTSEILKLCDNMLVLENGRLAEQGSPTKIIGGRGMSGKFQFHGELVAIDKQEVVYVLSILIGRDLVKVIADEAEVNKLAVGDKVMVASKAFNPVVRKLH